MVISIQEEAYKQNMAQCRNRDAHISSAEVALHQSRSMSVLSLTAVSSPHDCVHLRPTEQGGALEADC